MSSTASSRVTRQKIFSGSEYEKTYSYARAIVLGQQVLISGTTGYDYLADTLAEGAGAQARQIFQNAENALEKVGGTLRDVVRVRIYISHNEDYDAVMDAFAEAFRGVDPACTTVQAGLFDPEIRVEMDMDAVLDVVA